VPRAHTSRMSCAKSDHFFQRNAYFWRFSQNILGSRPHSDGREKGMILPKFLSPHASFAVILAEICV